jgi:hypothetical protein
MQDNPAPELTDDVFNWITTTIPETALVAPPTLLLDTICGKNDHKRVKGSVLTSGGDTSGLEALLGPNYRDVAISQLPSLVRSLRQKAEDVRTCYVFFCFFFAHTFLGRDFAMRALSLTPTNVGR